MTLRLKDRDEFHQSWIFCSVIYWNDRFTASPAIYASMQWIFHILIKLHYCRPMNVLQGLMKRIAGILCAWLREGILCKKYDFTHHAHLVSSWKPFVSDWKRKRCHKHKTDTIHNTIIIQIVNTSLSSYINI